MTKGVIPGSRSLSYVQQQELVRAKPGYKVPRLVDVAAVCFSEKLRSEQRLLSDDPWTWTRTEDQIDFWGFNPDGPDVNYDSSGYVSEEFGIVAMREL